MKDESAKSTAGLLSASIRKGKKRKAVPHSLFDHSFSQVYSWVHLHPHTPPAPAATILSASIPSPAGNQKAPELLIPGCLLKHWQPLSSPLISIS